MPDTVRLVYRGNPSLASALVSTIEAEGLTVAWLPPFERKSFGQDAVAVVEMTISGLAVAGIRATVKTAVAKFKERFHGTDVDIDQDAE